MLDGQTVKFTTKYEHDLTRPSKPLDDQTIILEGFGNVWDGEHQIIDVKNRMTFNIDLPSGETVAPSVDETQYLIENRKAGMVGVQKIASVVDVDNFTIDISDVPDLSPGPVDDLSIISGFRISAAANFDRAIATYSKQKDEEAYLFVILTDVDVSKDRHTLTDGVGSFTRQDMNKLTVLQQFSTTVFIPTAEDLAGIDAQEEVYGVIYSSLLASLFGFESEDAQAIKYLTVPVGMGPAEYNTAYYAHVYDWQLPSTITYEDGFLQWPEVAFRDIEQSLKLFNDAEAVMETKINLDDESL